MRLLLLSNSRKDGLGYLEWALPELRSALARDVRRAVFVPFALVTKSWDEYLEIAAPPFASIGVDLAGLHRAEDPHAALAEAGAIVVGGGNTWRLAREVHVRGLVDPIRRAVRAGVPYVGWSAGANLACPTFQTTNDMPICDPLGFDALGLVPFQINPHYLHGNPPGFQGETREQRILEYLEMNPRATVVGLRENCLFRVEGGAIRLAGEGTARVFRRGEEPRELGPDADWGFLLRPAGPGGPAPS